MFYFLFKLIPPRRTFALDMTEAEGAIMHRHFAYWSRLIAERKAVAYGPVMDPNGLFGIGVLESENRIAALSLAIADPAIAAKAGFAFEVHQIPDALVRP
jgi:hypothetical protein